MSNEANPGKELPGNAITVDAVLPDASLAASDHFPNRVFLFERDGGALFAHTQYGDRSRVYARGKELVVGFIVTLGNYDYLYQWVFRQDGSFGFETQLEGLVLSKTLSPAACQVCAQEAADGPGTYLADGPQAFGTLLAPQILGVQHQHWINLRLDFDIDGVNNAVKEVNTVPWKSGVTNNPRQRAFTIATTVFGREQQARRNCDDATNRTWVVYNPAVRSPLGHFAGYEIHPKGNTVSCLPDSRWGEETSFTQRHLWATRFHPDEIYAAGRYPNQARRDYQDDLYHYGDDNESIYNDDVVVWYSLGVTHLTKPEDYPIMAGVNAGVDFMPEGFFSRSPATIHAAIEVKP
jgi:primary-amine oxidase